jgi:glycosyltransferase involved in cell wall biosynthesis
MSVFNARRYVARAIESILSQAFDGFEFVIINDGSTDGSEEVIRSYTDPRIRIISQANRGLAASLNRGILTSHADYVAAKQIRFLDEHPEYALVGSAVDVIEPGGRSKFIMRHPTWDLCIRWHILFDSPFVHSSVVYRRDAVTAAGLYDEEGAAHVEDYELWSRIASRYKVANLREPLLRYLDNPEGVSHSRRDQQERNSLAVSARNIGALLGEPFPAERARGLRSVRLGQGAKLGIREILEATRDLDAVCAAFEAKHADELGSRPRIRHAIRHEVARAELAGSYFAWKLGGRDLSLRTAKRAVLRGPIALPELLCRRAIRSIAQLKRRPHRLQR